MDPVKVSQIKLASTIVVGITILQPLFQMFMPRSETTLQIIAIKDAMTVQKEALTDLKSSQTAGMARLEGMILASDNAQLDRVRRLNDSVKERIKDSADAESKLREAQDKRIDKLEAFRYQRKTVN